MKKLAAGVLAVLSTSAAFAGGNPEFVEFAVKAAHKRGFTACDTAIRATLNPAGGEDIRVLTDLFPETKSDQLQMLAVFGSSGDAVQVELNIRAQGTTCYVQRQGTITRTESCQQVLDSDNIELRNTTAGVLFAKTQGGGDAVLMPNGNRCIVKYRVGQKFPRG